MSISTSSQNSQLVSGTSLHGLNAPSSINSKTLSGRDECRKPFPEQKIFILGQEEYLGTLQSVSDLMVRLTSGLERDDMLGRQSVSPKCANEPQGKVFIQEDLHDTLRTAGAR